MSESVITSEIRYRRLFETAKDGILILDAETGMIEDVNPFLTGLLGYPYDSFIDKAVWELGFFKDIMANKEKFSELQQKEYVRYDDLPLETAQGKQINVEFVSNVYLEGKRKVIQCNIRDITKRRQMENLVLQTQKNYNTFFNTIDDFLFVLDIQGNIIQTNSTVTNRLGYSTDELTGKSVLFVHPPEMREEASDMVKDMLAGKTSVCLVPVMTKAGMRIPVETRVSRGVWDGRPVIFGVTKDISKIRLSEEKFSKLFHINPSACGLSDLDDFKYIEVNKAFCALLGFSQAEVIGKTAMELAIFSESERTSVLLNADPSGNVINVEARLKSKTGEIKHVLLSSENIYIQDKKYRFTVVNDITARKLAEVELADSKSRLELAMHAGNMAWWEMEKSTGNITFAKKKAEMLGYPPERFTHYTDFMELVHPEDVKKTMKAMQNHFDGLIDNYESEYRVLDQSGKYQWFHDIGSIVKRDPEGKPLLISGLVLNTTERKQTEIALHNNEVRLRTLVQTIPDLVWLKDTDGVYQSCNKMFERFFGATEANIIGKTDYDFVSSEQADWFRSHDYAAMTAKKPISNEEWISYADDGTRVYLDTIKTPMYDSEGVVIGVLGISHDITKRKKSEVDLLESEEKFKSIYEGSYDAIMLMNHTGFFDCNPRTLEMFGLKNKADFIGLHPSELSPPVQQDGRFSLLSAEEKITVAYQQGMNQFDWVHLRANGEEFPVKVTLSTFNLKEKPVIQATIRDLSTTEQQLIIANSALIFQNEEKENRAAELKIANTELAFQNEEKENRAAELKIANTELAFQNEEKENRAAELKIANT
ncbi:MAG: PAS domain S-box protein, partial [Bacteroidota bacterium]